MRDDYGRILEALDRFERSVERVGEIIRLPYQNGSRLAAARGLEPDLASLIAALKSAEFEEPPTCPVCEFPATTRCSRCGWDGTAG